MNKESGYDKITGEWEPEEWGTHYTDLSKDHDQLYYPPLLHKTHGELVEHSKNQMGKGWSEAWDKLYPHPNQHATSIGNGHHFQAMIWRNFNNDINAEYRIHGISPTEEEANKQADKYLDYHKKTNGILPEHIFRRDYEGDFTGDDYDPSSPSYYHFSNFYNVKEHNYPKCLDSRTSLHAERTIQPLRDKNNEKIIGYSWEHTNFMPVERYDFLGREGGFAKAQGDIEKAHKDLYDINKKNTKTAKVYSFDDNGNIKISDRMSPEELGPEFSGVDAPDQTVGDGINNQPQGVSETIPGDSFFTQSTLSSKTAGYDKVTGEWHPEQWTNGSGIDFYPPVTNIKWTNEDQLNWEENEDKSCAPHPELGTTSIGKGHIFQGNVDHSTDYAEGVYTIFGRAKTEQEALGETSRYEKIHKKTFGNDSYTHHWIFPILSDENKKIGYEWAQDHFFPDSEECFGDEARNNVGKLIEKAHKTMVDYNKMKNSSRRTAEIEDTNYQGIGPAFGEGMGPQDLSQNVTDVEEGPKGPKSTQDSTTQLPASLQGQAVLPDVTSWFTSSTKQKDDYDDSFTGEDDSDSDDEDDYDDNYSW